VCPTTRLKCFCGHRYTLDKPNETGNSFYFGKSCEVGRAS
jgi:hypothetical protein